VAAGFGGGSSATRLQLPDAAPGTAPVTADFNRVTAGYFSAARIPVLRGEVFKEADATAKTAVLDELAARQLFGEQDPIGRDVVYGNKTRATVIGVVSNVRMRGPEASSSPQAYFPGPATARSYSYLVRTTAPVSTVVPALQAAIASLRPEGSRPAEIRPVEGAFRNITARRRFSAGLMALFGALALLIGAAGVYGVVSSSVAQRTREIGLRQALGATRAQIAGAVLAQIGRQLAVGLTLGLLVAWFVSRGFAALFFEVRPTDAWVYALVASVLMVVGVAAALVPARRASRVDPLVALRVE
jgi:ABC-type antimicrobial peptide transport system permease subunit